MITLTELENNIKLPNYDARFRIIPMEQTLDLLKVNNFIYYFYDGAQKFWKNWSKFKKIKGFL